MPLLKIPQIRMLKKFAILTLFCAFFVAAWSFESVAQDDFSDEAEFETYETENEKEVYDPLEGLNRKVFAFNDFLDHYFLEYVAKTYRKDVPKAARDSVRNFLNNLSAPVSAFNSFLQGKGENGLTTFSNFLINSTIGIAGLFEVAGEKGVRYRQEDFGQTLGHYGSSSGPYLMIPFLGPSTVRDFSGMITDQVVNPTSYNAFKIGGKTYLIGEEALIAITVMRTVDSRESLIEVIDGIRQDSFDYYATIRSAYSQRRFNEIKN